MKTCFIHRQSGNTRLILIFAGWGSDASLYSDAVIPGWDTLVCYDFESFDFPAELVNGYSTVYLFAWSLGVAAAEQSLKDVAVTRAIALNGTPYPADNRRGIPVEIFRNTALNLDERNLKKFRRRMVTSSDEFKNILTLLPKNPDIEALRQQLFTFESVTPQRNIRWNRAYISSDDLIFPASAQHTAWEEADIPVETVTLDSGHYYPLSAIIKSIIPDISLIASSFSKSLDTYDNSAIPQRKVAETLCRMLSARGKQGGKVLEIGPGSGIFSRMYAPAISPSDITFVDLYDIPALGLAGNERYIVADAEEYMEHTDEMYDFILSSSAMQWFVNPERFILNAAKHLNPGGILACATYATDNLHQLNEFRPSPLLYAGKKETEETLRKHLTDVEIDSPRIEIKFSNGRQLLKHLRDTGVSGYTHTSGTAISLSEMLSRLSEDPRLEYVPLIFTAIKP